MATDVVIRFPKRIRIATTSLRTGLAMTWNNEHCAPSLNPTEQTAWG